MPTKMVFGIFQRILANLNQPYGMLIINDQFYVANTDGLWVYPYKLGDTKITKPGKRS
jgi:glucose/arabinose dehydrogenase